RGRLRERSRAQSLAAAACSQRLGDQTIRHAGIFQRTETRRDRPRRGVVLSCLTLERGDALQLFRLLETARHRLPPGAGTTLAAALAFYAARIDFFCHAF